MTEYQSELLAFIEEEFQKYSLMPTDNSQAKRDKKEFINGLMTAARVIGVGYDELNLIVKSTASRGVKGIEYDLSTPAYIRQQNK
ncbi:hypothetical protein A165_00920 [Vibrio tasmaniensis ZS-17]|uniref:hypothetical protein n=1 Tax=Vibrio tasmaniensis TaxID=212663 RepID=UPI0002E2DFA1|nr:hypothetical protein [Vibrio tasmaniensis]OED65907.1 hypothetical protein A165_00920 [Vibrio tasmaniensis ZS-17]